MRSFFRACVVVAVLATAPACSLKTYAINMVGDALSAGDSVYQTDDDLELVGAALPFGLKLTESLLGQSPNHPGLLLTACRGFTLYPYAYVGHAAEIAADDDLDRARALRAQGAAVVPPGVRVPAYVGSSGRTPASTRALASEPAAAVSVIRDEQPREGSAVPLLVGRVARPGHFGFQGRRRDARTAAGGPRAARSGADR